MTRKFNEIKFETPPKAVNVSQTYDLETNKAGFYHTDNEKGDQGDYLGVEFESCFSPGTTQLRYIADWLKEKSSFKLTPMSNSNSVRAHVKDTIISQATEILMQNPHYDGGGVECVMKPATLAAHQRLKPEYAKIIDIFASFGFTDIEGGDGIHLNIDKTMFGQKAGLQRRSFEMFLWFLFFNIDFMVEFTDRKRHYQFCADMYHLLGDIFALKDEDELLKKFKEHKVSLLDTLASSSSNFRLNMSVNRDGRPCIEFRWFGSTHNIEKFMSNIEFMYAISEFCRGITTENLAKLQNFCNFVRTNHAKFPHLLADLQQNSYAAEHLATVQQPVATLVSA